MSRYQLPTRKEVLTNKVKLFLSKSLRNLLQVTLIAGLISLPFIFYFY